MATGVQSNSSSVSSSPSHPGESRSAEDASPARQLSSVMCESEEDQRTVVDLFSSLVASYYTANTCEEHENCDGSCSGSQVAHLPILSAQPSAVSAKMFAGDMPNLDAPRRDKAWLDAEELEKFQYEPLDSSINQIRLVRVHTAVYRQDVVQLDMATVSLDDSPEFQALSYVWGEPDFAEPVLCNGKKTAVTKSLNAALKGFRQSNSNKGEFLWVDALCINQADKPERSQQVQLMGRIYAGATGVCIDIGEFDDTGFAGIDLMYRLAFMYEALEDSKDLQEKTADQLSKMFHLPPSEHPAWMAYARLFSAPWFTRTWVLQEVALAQEAWLRAGRFTFDWFILVHSFQGFANSSLVGKIRILEPGFLNMFHTVELCRRVQRPESRDTLLRLLTRAKNFSVTDSRDKVLGMLGILGPGPTSAKLGYLVDYSLSVDEIYHRTAVHMVRLGVSDAFLGYAGLHRRECVFKIPSWSVDWTAQSRWLGPAPFQTLRNKSFAASTATASYAYLREDSSRSSSGNAPLPRELVVVGARVGAIKSLGIARPAAAKEGTATPAASCRELLAWHASAEQCLSNEYEIISRAYDDTEDAFCRTLLINDLYTGVNACPGAASLSDLPMLRQASLEWLKTEQGSKGDGRDTDTFLMQMGTVIKGRRFAVTEKGLIGLVPACCRKGDVVAIFSGAPVPYIIRPVIGEAADEGDAQASFQLLGDAYIHGLMEGEADTMRELQRQEIVLV